jgi:hypothetical protein
METRREPSGDIPYRMHEYGMELIYKYRSGGDEWKDVSKLIPFAWTDQHLGEAAVVPVQVVPSPMRGPLCRDALPLSEVALCR